MNPCALIFLTISTILLLANASEDSQQKRLQTEPSSSCKKLKYDGSSTTKKVITVKNEKKLYVAVIGGGINAALFTHYLQELINAEVHIYNHGKIQKTENSSFIVHENHKYMMEIISKLNLDTMDLNQTAAMYDGQDNQVLNFQKENLVKPILEHYFIKQMLKKFEKIYDAQQKYSRSFLTPSALLLGMSEAFQISLKTSTKEFIKKKNWKTFSFIEKIIHSLLLINYGQHLESNAFAGLTSLMFSQSTGKLKQITTPVQHIVPKLLTKSDEFLNLNVLKVTYEKFSKDVFRHRVISINKDGKEFDRIYNYVVIATPEIDDIDFSQLKEPIVVCKNRKISVTRVTASLKDDDILKKWNLVTTIANLKDDGSFRFARKITNSEWEIIADDNGDALTEISSIFSFSGTTKVKKMALWPDYSDKECAINATFVLYPKMFYLNAIECASSLLEMKAIGAMNVALRIKTFKDQLIGFKK